MKTRHLILVLLSIIIWTTSCGSTSSHPQHLIQATVSRVFDGDTIAAQINGKAEKIRLIGMDTPETKKPNTPVMYYGPEASAYTQKRLEHQQVELEFDVEERDRYGRLLAYVWINRELFNRTLVQKGYARMYTFPPNVKYVELFKEDQASARKKNLGIWKDYDQAFKK